MQRCRPVYRKMGLVFMLVSFLALLVFIMDSLRAPDKNNEGKSILRRGDYGSGSEDIDLEVELDGREGEMTVALGEKRYKKEEMPQVFEEAAASLEELILGENKSLDEVRHNLNLPDQIPGTGIEVAWEVGDYDILNLLGEIKTENLKEEGTLLELRALLTYGEEEAVHTFYVNVLPPKLTKWEKKLEKLKAAVQEQESKTGEEGWLTLPDEVDGNKVTWKYPKDSRAGGLFILGIVAAVGVYALDKQKKKQRKEDRKKQMTADYPQIISQFALFLGAGMTARAAWFKVVEEYGRQKGRKGRREAYEEMAYTMHEIQQGVSESQCYEKFGMRCGLASYRKFGSMLSQNLRKGTKGMADLLKKEAADAFEDRKNRARKLGEEAGTKLLGPMFMMLAVVIVIIVIPAFFTIQI